MWVIVVGFLANKSSKLLQKECFTKFKENRSKIVTSRAHLLIYSFEELLKPCSGDQDRCTFRGPGLDLITIII